MVSLDPELLLLFFVLMSTSAAFGAQIGPTSANFRKRKLETSFLQHESKIEDSLQFFPDYHRITRFTIFFFFLRPFSGWDGTSDETYTKNNIQQSQKRYMVSGSLCPISFIKVECHVSLMVMGQRLHRGR